MKTTSVRKVVIVLFGVLLTILLYQLFWSDGSSTSTFFNIVPKGERQLADGFWGTLGFYEDPADNIMTYILLGLIVLSIGFRIYSRNVKKPLPKKKSSSSKINKKR